LSRSLEVWKLFRIFDSYQELNVGNQPNKPTKLQ